MTRTRTGYVGIDVALRSANAAQDAAPTEAAFLDMVTVQPRPGSCSK